VLRDGATAQYGSDAIAGVLNYGIRRQRRLRSWSGQAHGQFYAGDGESYQVAGNAGTRSDRGFINVSAQSDDDGRTSRGVTRPLAVEFAEENPSLANTDPVRSLQPARIWHRAPRRRLQGGGERCL